MDRTVVAITGASSGIGETFARTLAPAHDLILIARRKERLDALAAEFRTNFGANVAVIQADLVNRADADRIAERLASEPRLILLINNAGFGVTGRFWEAPLEVQEQMHELHVMTTVRLTHAALRNLVARDAGGIINVASVAAFVRSGGSVSYGATKSWMVAFTEGLYLELQDIGSHIAVQALCPGFTYSEFHDRLAVRRGVLAGSSMWLSAQEVVDASLEGLKRRKLVVIPGWRYRLFVAAVSKLPERARLALERAGTRRRGRAFIRPAATNSEQIDTRAD